MKESKVLSTFFCFSNVISSTCNPYIAVSLITIPPNATLVLADNDALVLHATGIVVNGELWAGAETCPLGGTVAIELRGARPATAKAATAAPHHVKGIHVFDAGRLELHGRVEEEAQVDRHQFDRPTNPPC